MIWIAVVGERYPLQYIRLGHPVETDVVNVDIWSLPLEGRFQNVGLYLYRSIDIFRQYYSQFNESYIWSSSR